MPIHNHCEKRIFLCQLNHSKYIDNTIGGVSKERERHIGTD